MVLALCFFFLINTLHAQHSKTILLDKIDTFCNDTKVDFKVRTFNFTNVTAFQGTIGWDSSVIQLDSIVYGTNNSSDFLNDSNTSFVFSANAVSFNWNETVKRRFPDKTTLFTLKFTILNAVGFKTSVYFILNQNSFPEIDTFNTLTSTTTATTDTSFINGYIGFADTPIIIQKGNELTCEASCIPSMYQWYVNGKSIMNDSFKTITITGNGLYTVSVSYNIGNTVSSLPKNVFLPVELLSFNAIDNNNNNTTTLNWVTSNETSSTYYNIGRKVNGENYKTIATIKAKVAPLESDYTYIDKEPLKGIVCYQLQLVDNDGSKHYSKIDSLNKNAEYVYTIYPDPSHHKISVEGQNIVELNVIDIDGKIVERKRYSVMSDKRNMIRAIELPIIAKGGYSLKIINLDGSYKVKKFEVN